jgi:hypothetical protein
MRSLGVVLWLGVHHAVLLVELGAKNVAPPEVLVELAKLLLYVEFVHRTLLVGENVALELAVSLVTMTLPVLEPASVALVVLLAIWPFPTL